MEQEYMLAKLEDERIIRAREAEIELRILTAVSDELDAEEAKRAEEEGDEFYDQEEWMKKIELTEEAHKRASGRYGEAMERLQEVERMIRFYQAKDGRE